MASNALRGASRWSGRALWAAVGIGALGVLVLALSFVALTENRDVAGAGSTPGAVSTTEPPATSAPPAESVPAEAAAAPVAAPTRVLAAFDGQRAARAGVTACPTPTAVEVTDDGGVTWLPSDAATVAAVQWLQAGEDAFVAAIGSDASTCALSYERSFVDGDAWQASAGELAGLWHLDAIGSVTVNAPGRGAVAAPCPVMQLAPIDTDSAAALCADSTVVATDDGGANWTPGAAVRNAVALTATSTGYAVAIRDASACTGAQVIDIMVVAGNVSAGSAGACFGASAGSIAISASGAEIWIWVDDVVGHSTDLGESWS